MNLSQYIINDVKPRSVKDTIGEIQSVFNHLTFSHLPIIKDNKFIGMISENDTYCYDSEKKVEDYLYSVEHFFVTPLTNWLDVLEAFALNSCNVIPILDSKRNYLGYYELNDIISLFSEMPFFLERGAVLVVEKGTNDFSFSEISQIVESNNVKLLGAFISKATQDLIQVTIKINNAGLGDIMHTFRRYGYNIISSHEEDSYTKNLKEHSEYLKKYLNI